MQRPETPLSWIERLSAAASNQPVRRGRPGGGAEFLAALAQPLADVVGELGRERPAADARAVGLGDAQHVVQVHRPDAGAGRRRARDAVRRGDVRDRCRGRCRAASPARPRTAGSCPARLASYSARGTSATSGSEARRERERLVQRLLEIDLRLLVEVRQHEVVEVEQLLQLVGEAHRLEAGPAGGSRGAPPCPRRPGRCRGRWCRSSARPSPPRAPGRARTWYGRISGQASEMPQPRRHLDARRPRARPSPAPAPAARAPRRCR